MKISPRGLELIKDFEGFSSTSYLDVVNIPTIGWGNTFYEDGTKVKLGDQISKTDALKLLEVIANRDFADKIFPTIEVKVTQKPIRVTNCIDGFSKFITKLETISSNTNDFIIGLEATGIYGENLWEFLNSHGFNVKLLNPFQTTRYREQHTMKKVKNDNIDSWIIALFLKDGKFSSGYVTNDEYQSLRTSSWIDKHSHYPRYTVDLPFQVYHVR